MDINFLGSKRLKDEDVSKIIQDSKLYSSKTKTKQEQESKSKKDYEKKIYKDVKLQKALNFAELSISQANKLIEDAQQYVSKDKIRDIKVMIESITKLKM